MNSDDIIRLMRTCSLANVRAELEALQPVDATIRASKIKGTKAQSNLQEFCIIAAFYQRAAKRK